MGKAIRVLLVEDDEFDQLAFNRFVEKEELPYEVQMAASVDQARLLLEEDHFDVALIDYHLGSETAMDLLNTIENLPCIVVTGAGREEIAVEAMKAGAMDYLVKDLNGRHFKTLPLVVENVIHRRKAERELEQYRLDLETLVKERTTDLVRANEALSQEIREREQAETQIRLLASALESAANSIVITDAQGIIQWVNPAFTRLTGYEAEEIVGEVFRFLKSTNPDNNFYQDIWHKVQSGRSWHGELINRRKDNSTYYEEMTITPVRDVAGEISNFIAIKQDVTERVETKQRLEYLSSHDLVTELPNRLLFNDRLKHAVTLAKRYDKKGAVLFIDLDDFKAVNDAFSHEDGDRLLNLLAKRLLICLRESDTIARIGGDEFAILLEEVANIEDIAVIAQKLIQEISEPTNLKGSEVFITASIGISVFPDDGDNIPTLLQNADAAMYRAKEKGKNTYQYYTTEMTERILERLNLETRLRHALEEDEFLLHYQPQVDSSSGKIVGVEALLRLTHPERGIIPPKEFIPVAERNGSIIPIGEWVLQTACSLGKAWQDAGIPNIRTAVNISGRQLKQSDLVESVKKALDATGLKPGLLELEISEDVVFKEVEQTISVLNRLKSLGIKLAIDDFGTGYSSLGHLARFPLDTIKIDHAFTSQVTNDPNAVAVVSGMIAIAKSLNMGIIVEGIETAEQLALFQSLGCNLIQGWFYSPSLPAEEIEPLLRTGF